MNELYVEIIDRGLYRFGYFSTSDTPLPVEGVGRGSVSRTECTAVANQYLGRNSKIPVSLTKRLPSKTPTSVKKLLLVDQSRTTIFS